MSEYTAEYFKRLEEIVDIRPQKCRDCGVADGKKPYDKKGRPMKFPAIVRLCLIDPKGNPADWNNVAMFCTRCRKPNEVWRTPRRIKPQLMPQLFGDR